jgi:hypothetical protein
MKAKNVEVMAWASDGVKNEENGIGSGGRRHDGASRLAKHAGAKSMALVALSEKWRHLAAWPHFWRAHRLERGATAALALL